MFWLIVSGGLVWLATKIVGSQDYRNTVHWCYVARHRIREREQKGLSTFGADGLVKGFLACEEQRQAAVIQSKAYWMYACCEFTVRKKNLMRALCGRRRSGQGQEEGVGTDSEHLGGTKAGRPGQRGISNCNSMSDCCNCDDGSDSDDEMAGPGSL